MRSNRTVQLYSMYVKSLEEDFRKWLLEVVEEEVQKYIKTKVCFVEFVIEQEYDDNDYYDAVTSINFYDADKTYIDIEEDVKEDIKDVPDFYNLKYEAMGGVMDELMTLGLSDMLIDLGVTINVNNT